MLDAFTLCIPKNQYQRMKFNGFFVRPHFFSFNCAYGKSSLKDIEYLEDIECTFFTVHP